MALKFQKATKKQSRLRIAYDGPAGSGKTFTALRIAALMLGGEDQPRSNGVVLPRRDNGAARIAFIDTEHGSASLYSDIFTDGDGAGCFDVVELGADHQGAVDPPKVIEAFDVAEDNGYEYVIVDSLSHAWEGILSMKDAKDKSGGNSFTNWREVTPIHNRLVQKILSYPGHVAACMRTKTEYEIVTEGQKTKVNKVGSKPVAREGVEFEFTVVYDMASGGIASLSKSRCHALNEREVIEKPGLELATILVDWLETGEEMPMTRKEFVAGVYELIGVTSDEEIAGLLRKYDLLSITGRNKYELMLDGLREGLESDVALRKLQAANAKALFSDDDIDLDMEAIEPIAFSEGQTGSAADIIAGAMEFDNEDEAADRADGIH